MLVSPELDFFTEWGKPRLKFTADALAFEMRIAPGPAHLSCGVKVRQSNMIVDRTCSIVDPFQPVLPGERLLLRNLENAADKRQHDRQEIFARHRDVRRHHEEFGPVLQAVCLGVAPHIDSVLLATLDHDRVFVLCAVPEMRQRVLHVAGVLIADDHGCVVLMCWHRRSLS